MPFAASFRNRAQVGQDIIQLRTPIVFARAIQELAVQGGAAKSGVVCVVKELGVPTAEQDRGDSGRCISPPSGTWT